MKTKHIDVFFANYKDQSYRANIQRLLKRVNKEKVERSIIAEINWLPKDVKKQFADEDGKVNHDGLEFFNVKPGYVVESGSPKNSFQIGSGRKLTAEFSNTPFTRGTVGMSRLLSDPDSADSQFFITLGRVPGFDNKYTVWGEVVSGIKVLENLSPGSPPKNPDKIFKVRLIN